MLILCILWDPAFSLERLYGANIDFGFKGSIGTIIATKEGIENVVSVQEFFKSILCSGWKQGVEFNSKSIQMEHTRTTGLGEWQFFLFSVSFKQVDGSGTNVVLTWHTCSFRRRTRGLAEVLGMRISPETSETAHITDLTVNGALWGSTDNVWSESSMSTSIKFLDWNVTDLGVARTMCALRTVCLRV